MSLGGRLKQLRTENNMKQSDLAEVLGISNVAVSHYENETKNESSNRTIAVDDDTMKLMFDYIAYKRPTSYLFAGEDNKPISHNAVVKALSKDCKRANIPVVTPHALRHTHASLLLASGMDMLYIADRLGHSSTYVTETTYIHIIEELKQHSNKQLNDLMSNLS